MTTIRASRAKAELQGMSRGSIYYLTRPVSVAVLTLIRRIDELHPELPFMRACILRDQLKRENIQVDRRHIATRMQRMGIKALALPPGNAQQAPQSDVFPSHSRSRNQNGWP